jgi:hypothetical protein
MEPGTFKDRYLLEHDPHMLVEGMIIAAHAIQADYAYIFIRGEYHVAAKQLAKAIEDAYAKGYLGSNVFGTGYALQMRVHRSGGRYICGEETALLNALEGKRAQPRSKPPFPPVSGAWGRPTVVNNAESLCNVPAILRNGAEWYRTLGKGEDAGTKMFGVSGREQAGAVGTAHGHHHPRTARSARGRHEARLQDEGHPAGRRLHRLPGGTAPRPADGIRRHPEGRQPHGHGHHDHRGRLGVHRGRVAQPAALLRAGVLRLLHAVP